jgi:putative ABC transport system substrate-binding protein
VTNRLSYKRRDFITLLGGAAGAWPLAAHAQQAAMPVVGFLNTASPGPFAPLVAAFREGLKDGGYIEGQNVAIEYRWAEGQYDRLPALAADLVRRQVAVIAATGGTVSAMAAKAATSTIPVLFIGGANPVSEGLVSSFNRPGGNVTGVSTYMSELAPKRLELLRELMPKATKIALLINPENAADWRALVDMEPAARVAKVTLLIVRAKVESEFEPAFTAMVQQGAEALLVSADPIFNSRRAQLVALAAHYAIPAAYPWREYAIAGGLMSYGPSISGLYRQIAQYVTRILKGDKPGDLPVQNPTKFELLINLKTARARGLTVPPTLLALADEVIE